MIDRETSLIERWRADRPIYAAWGKFVADTLVSEIAREIQPAAVDFFLRIPVKFRTKDEASLLAKAFHRSKPYSNPYDEIEDKVGLRVVVLFSEEIRIVEQVVLRNQSWEAAKARDFEEERRLRPFEFDYQSLHYILRARERRTYESVDIPAGTPCEVQVRTLLQHAYSELTHDTIYKPSVTAQPEVKRAAAKSMALIEATDDYFTQVFSKLEKAQAPGRVVAAAVDSAYVRLVEVPSSPSPLNTLLIDYFRQWTDADFRAHLDAFLAEKPYVVDRIKERAPTSLLYRQPAILLVYFSVRQAARAIAETSPLSRAELEPIYSDLGIRFPE